LRRFASIPNKRVAERHLIVDEPVSVRYPAPIQDYS
jgi:hypothetical protein